MPPITYPMPLQLALGEKNAASTSDTGKKVAILVAGVNYPRRPFNEDVDRGRTYFNYCVNYKDYLFKENKVDSVVIFDFLNGETLGFTGGAKAKGVKTLLNGPLHGKTIDSSTPTTRRSKASRWAAR